LSYLIDTNALSELKKRQPHPNVAAWFAARPAASLYLSVLTLGELRKGIEAMADGPRKTGFRDWLETDVPGYFAGRILIVDAGIADRWGQPAGRHRPGTRPESGHPQPRRFPISRTPDRQSLVGTRFMNSPFRHAAAARTPPC
jgi:predicted nucleic acid-binding protein